MQEKTQRILYLISNSLLFGGISIYFGTGWSTTFQFSVMDDMTPENYYLHFIPQIDAATNFFTVMVSIMVAACGIMLWREWRTRFRWVPIALLLLILGSTAFTLFVVFPINDDLRAGVTDQAELDALVETWVLYTWTRVVLWTIEWAIMMYYLAATLYLRQERAQAGPTRGVGT